METALTGITLHVSDMEQSKAFYLRVPGANLVFERPGEYAIIRIGDARVGLIRKDIIAQEGAGSFHLEIGASDLEALRTHLGEAGITPVGPQPELWGQRGMITRDPDGNMIEFDDHLSVA